MRDAFVNKLSEIAAIRDDVWLVLADLGIFIFDDFRATYPKRYVNVGIAEANMIGIAAGLAASGKIPFAYSIAPFITGRCFDQIRVDLCYQERNVKLVGVGGGFVYETLGATHHAIEDIALMRSLPNMTVIAPADPKEAERATEAAFMHEGPVYLRLGRNNDPQVYDIDADFKIGRSVLLKDGLDASIIASGTAVATAVAVSKVMAEDGYSIRIINMHTVKPIDKDAITKAAIETKVVVTLEDHNVIGGLGSAVSEVIAEEQGAVKFRRLGLPDTFCNKVGSIEYIRGAYNLDVGAVVKTIESLLKTVK